MRNLIASGLVAFAVSSVVADASPNPSLTEKPTHGISTAALASASVPSAADRLAALTRRVDALQIRLADTRTIAMSARTTAENADGIAACVTGAVWVMTDPTTNALMGSTSASDVGAFPVATVDPTCAS